MVLFNRELLSDKGAGDSASIEKEVDKENRIFHLIGDIKNKGEAEVPIGTSLREVIYNIGGGLAGGKEFKALQTDGLSAALIPEHLLELKIGEKELTEAGFNMKSGRIIVMDEDTCMFNTAMCFTEYLAEATCGKCVPCREGLRQMNTILTNITKGEGQNRDIGLIEELSETMREASLCAIGKKATNHLLSALKYFKSEFEAYISKNENE